MTQRIKVMIAKDQKMVREGLTLLLEQDPEISVIGDAENGKELLRLINKQKPDVVLCGLSMSMVDGLQTLELIKEDFPDIKVIIVTSYFNPIYINFFIQKGANAYIPQKCGSEVLLKAIHTVYDSTFYFDDPQIVHDFNTCQNMFTEMESIVLHAICKGKTNKEIGQELGISHNTVDFHRKNIYSKTGVQNAALLLLFAIRHNLVSTFEIASLDKAMYTL